LGVAKHARNGIASTMSGQVPTAMRGRPLKRTKTSVRCFARKVRPYACRRTARAAGGVRNLPRKTAVSDFSNIGMPCPTSIAFA